MTHHQRINDLAMRADDTLSNALMRLLIRLEILLEGDTADQATGDAEDGAQPR
jgi:hypothetical protein